MISLSSCTKKLNSVESLTTCSWPEVGGECSSPLTSNTNGYREMMLNFLDDAYSLPGMYASLLVIKKSQESIGKGHGNVCNISAVMCGVMIKWIDDSPGVPIEERRRNRQKM